MTIHRNIIHSDSEPEKEELDDENVELDLSCISCKIISETGENGFDRGWEVLRM